MPWVATVGPGWCRRSLQKIISTTIFFLGVSEIRCYLFQHSPEHPCLCVQGRSQSQNCCIGVLWGSHWWSRGASPWSASLSSGDTKIRGVVPTQEFRVLILSKSWTFSTCYLKNTLFIKIIAKNIPLALLNAPFLFFTGLTFHNKNNSLNIDSKCTVETLNHLKVWMSN